MKKVKKLFYIPVTLFLVSMLIMSCSASNMTSSENEGILLALLKNNHREGRYHVFNPELSFHGEANDDDKLDDTTLKYIKEKFKEKGYNFDSLLNKLNALNSKPVVLTIPSSQEDGYVIDYDGKYKAYFDEGILEGWNKFREENPDAGSFVRLSQPVYDKNRGIVLVYIGWSADWLMGSGSITAFNYTDGTLEKITSVQLWES